MQVGQFSVPSFLAARAQHNTTQQHTGANAEVCAVVLPVVMNVPTPKQQHEEGYGDGRGVKGAIPIPVNQQGSKAISNTQIMSRAALLHVLLAVCRKNAEIPTMVFFAVIGSVRLRLRIADGHHGKYLLPNRYRTIAHYNKTTSTYCTVTGLVCNKTFSWLKEGRRARERKRTRSTRPLARRRRGKYRYRYCSTCTCRDIYR